MKVKQKNLRVFHIVIEDKATFIEYFNKNSVILKEFFLLLEGCVDAQIAQLLDAHGVCYKDISNYNLRLGNVKQEQVPQDAVKTEQIDLFSQKSEQKSMAIYHRPIRSGEEIYEEIPVVVFGRINSGAKLFCTQSVSIYGQVDGLVQCDGEFLVLMGVGEKGHVVFNGEILDKTNIKSNQLQKISRKDGKNLVREM
ncbi:MAG: septum site-determining protein MinC [Sulfurospirillum sp.]|nr:septum site-determining protein MinC [Sulfurospirillum sp.]